MTALLRGALRGAALGLAWGLAARIWMRAISPEPRFSWAGTIAIVGLAAWLGIGTGLLAPARGTRHRPWWALLAAPGLLLFAGPGLLFLPAFVLGGLALSGRAPIWRIVGVLAVAAPVLAIWQHTTQGPPSDDGTALFAAAGFAMLSAGLAVANSAVFPVGQPQTTTESITTTRPLPVPQGPIDANAAASTQPAHGSSMCTITSFKYTDPFVTENYDDLNAQLQRLSAAGFYGDPSVNLARKRLSKIDFDNPATAQWIQEVPTVADWMALIPTAAALDPIYRPDLRELPSGRPISPQMREWFCNSADARGIRSRAAAFTSLTREHITDNPRDEQWLSLACGAAHPVLAAAALTRDAGRRIPAMTLLDLDRESLKLAARYGQELGLLPHMTLRRANVLDPRGISARDLERSGVESRPPTAFDVVEAIGLLEYLKLEDWDFRYGTLIHSKKRLAGARTFLRTAYALVRPGGLLVVANMRDTHPQLAFTLNVVQWPHIQPRAVESMLALIRDAGLKGNVRVLLPTDGVYAMYVITKPMAVFSDTGSGRESARGQS